MIHRLCIALVLLLPAMVEAAEKKPVFGVKVESIAEMEPKERKERKMGFKSGLLLTDVAEDKPAARAGLRPDDVLLTAGGKALKKPADLVQWLTTTNHGETYPLIIMRQLQGRWNRQTVQLAAEFTDVVKKPAGLKVTPLSNVYYLPSGGRATLHHFLDIRYDGELPKFGYFDVGGVDLECSVQSSDPSIVSHWNKGVATEDGVSREQRQYEFKKAGRVQLLVAVGGFRAMVPMQVVELPFKEGDREGDVIAALGEPSEKTKVVVTGERPEFIDGITYERGATGAIRVEHWTFKRFPKLVVAMERREVRQIATIPNPLPNDALKVR